MIKNRKGISLIVLIITIIVMIILAGTIILSLNNSGIIGKANEAVDKSNRNTELDQIQTEAMLARGTNNKVDFKKLESYSGKSITYLGEKTLTHVTENGNVFSIQDNGAVTDITTFAKYILGENLEGRYIYNEQKLENGEIDANSLAELDEETGFFVFKQDPLNANSTVHSAIAVLAEEVETVNAKLGFVDNKLVIPLTINYMEQLFLVTFVVDETTLDVFTVAGELFKVEKLYNIGKYVNYKGITWRVLHDNAEKVTLITADAIGEVMLEGDDFSTSAALQSCENAKMTLIEAARKEIGINENIGIGGADYGQLEKYNMLIADNEKPYWAGGRYTVDENRYHYMHYITGDGTWEKVALVESNKSYDGGGAYDYYGRSASYPIRPTITLAPGVLDFSNAAGTKLDPINLK